MYPEVMLIPMREELTRAGVQELKTAEDVERVIEGTNGTVMVVVNSICGCAAGKMRPAVRLALQNHVKPEKIVSVFAGQDADATERAREYFTGWPPSSPSIALLREGKLLFFVPRSSIESRDAQAIAAELVGAFHKFCAAPLANASD